MREIQVELKTLKFIKTNEIQDIPCKIYSRGKFNN